MDVTTGTSVGQELGPPPPKEASEFSSQSLVYLFHFLGISSEISHEAVMMDHLHVRGCWIPTSHHLYFLKLPLKCASKDTGKESWAF